MLKLNNVTYQYGEQTQALKGITTDLPAGSFHFLCGPSGAGKTTLFRMLYLDLLPSSGQYYLFGKNVNQLSRDEIALTRRRMGIVFQDFRLLPHLSIAQNVLLPLTLHGQPTQAQMDAVKEIIDWVGLGEKMDRHPYELSGGEQQRVAIARAVVNRPKVLIADEPTGNIDAMMGRKIFHLFTELHKHGTTVVVATHDRDLVQRFKFPCLYLEDGQIVSGGSK